MYEQYVPNCSSWLSWLSWRPQVVCWGLTAYRQLWSVRVESDSVRAGHTVCVCIPVIARNREIPTFIDTSLKYFAEATQHDTVPGQIILDTGKPVVHQVTWNSSSYSTFPDLWFLHQNAWLPAFSKWQYARDWYVRYCTCRHDTYPECVGTFGQPQYPWDCHCLAGKVTCGRIGLIAKYLERTVMHLLLK